MPELSPLSPDPPLLTIDLEADATLGYAAIQNDVPILRAVRITNIAPQPLTDVDLLVRCDPAFARGARVHFDSLAPGESRRIAPVDLTPDHAFLADNVEALRGAISIDVVQAGAAIGRRSQPIEILAYDQWAGTRALPELIAAFSMPNDPAVDGILGRASALLRSSAPDLSLDGYQSKHRERVWKQISAIYSTIAAENLQYAEPPASFGTDGQKIRTPDRILEGRIATCLDLTMLFCSCLEQAGLRPLVLFREGHAWCGVWLHEAAFATPLVDDVQSVRKRVDAGELFVFETTGVAQHASLRPSLRHALEQGARQLQDAGAFRFAVDIQRARQQRIRPLPSRATSIKRVGVPEVDEPVGIEPTPVLPPLDPMSLPAVSGEVPDTPAGRLAKWKAKLLDLTLRNRLLNFKATKASLQLLAPDLGALEDALFEGKEFRVREKPKLMTGADPRDAQVHAARHGVDAMAEQARERLAKGEIVTCATEDALEGHLLALYRDAKTGLEEGGSNTLYLALGFLRWVESPQAESVHLAPLLLVPVTMQRASVRSGFRLSRHDDETILNPTLLELLRQQHGMHIRGVDPLPTDEKGIDVAKVLQSFRLAVAELPRWEVLDDAYLGIFSFTKYLMWKDLSDRSEQLKTNRVVRHLLENPGSALAGADDRGGVARLDDSHGPADLLAPLLCDSSQLEAIRAVDAGHDLVLEGPPGTGKSQTITNLIAHLLAKSKTVLFVSEKITALEVVHRRLNDVGLGPFCLELHSAKAKKLDVVQQLGDPFAARPALDTAAWTREADRLASLRRDLNAVVDALHHRHANGLTVHEAISTGVVSRDVPLAKLAWADADAHDIAALEVLRESVRQIAALASEVGELRDHPLAAIRHTEWTHSWQARLESTIESTGAAAQRLQIAVTALGAWLPEATAGGSVELLAALDNVADVLLRAPRLPSGLARRANDPSARSQLAILAGHANTRNEQWAVISGTWKEDLLAMDSAGLARTWSAATNTWWPRSWLRKRALRKRLIPLRSDAAVPSDAEIVQMIEALGLVHAEDRALAAHAETATDLLGEEYTGVETNWAAISGLEEWARGFSQALDQLESRDPVSLASVRERLTPLVAEQRHLLAPGSAVGASLVAFRQAWHDFTTELRVLGEIAAVDRPLTGAPTDIGGVERVLATIASWRGAVRMLQPWCLWRRARRDVLAQNLAGVVECLERGEVPLGDAARLFERSYRDWWCKRVIDATPALRAFSTADHERKIQEFREVDQRFEGLTRAYIVATLCANVPVAAAVPGAADSELGTLQRERQKQRKHLPVRQLIASLPTMLPRLKPCLLMSPLSVAQYLDAGQSQFDVVVFDEASQIPVWDAIGVIARGKQVVVVGDPKQLPPTNFFAKSSGDDAATGDDAVEDLESILDECMGVGMRRLSLQWHYRSRHESLIHFSNVTYYGSRLITFPSPRTQDQGVRLVRVNGEYDRGGSCTNRAEADAVVRYIEEHMSTPGGARTSLGVVTFNSAQQDLIETLLDDRRRVNAALDHAIATAKGEPLFIKNLEAVQGDERDVILFSTTYGPDKAGKMTMNFGPINRDGGHRRLNVAVSRARLEVVVFSGLRPEHFSSARTGAAGVRDLMAYISFAEKGPRALLERSAPTGREADSPFETEVATALRERGWDVHLQVGCSGYRIDMAVVDPRAPGRYLLGVECDGRAYHSGATARDRDRLRQLVLESLGWRLHRIWSTDWWRDRARALDRVHALLEQLVAEPVAVDGTDSPACGPDGPDPQATEVSSDGLDGQAAPPATPATLRSLGPLAAPRGADDPPKSAEATEPIYVICGLRSEDPAKFDNPSTSAVLRRQLSEVVATEGPVLDTVAFQRVAKAWGFSRMGAKIRGRIEGCLPVDVLITREGQRKFLWPPTLVPSTWRGYRLPSEVDDSRRSVDEICLHEIGNLTLSVLNQQGRCGTTDLIRFVARRLGVGRTSADIEQRLRAALDDLVARGLATTREGYATPTTR